MKDRRELVREFFALINDLRARGYIGTEDARHHCDTAREWSNGIGDHVYWCEEHKIYDTADTSG